MTTRQIFKLLKDGIRYSIHISRIDSDQMPECED